MANDKFFLLRCTRPDGSYDFAYSGYIFVSLEIVERERQAAAEAYKTNTYDVVRFATKQDAELAIVRASQARYIPTPGVPK